MSGWAIDPNTSGPLDVHIYVDGVGRANVRADRTRSDIGQAYREAGPHHGFEALIRDLPPGRRSVCAYGINQGEGGNSLLGCINGTVSSTPFGYFESAVVQNGQARVRGWAIDPDTDNPIAVHVYVDGVGVRGVIADLERPDVAAGHSRGSRHGFDTRVNIKPGFHDLSVYAIGVGAGGNRGLGTRRVYWDGSPFGHLDSVTRVGSGQVRVQGWAIDPHTSGPLQVHIYSDGRGVLAVTANRERPDVAVLGRGTAHGFDVVVNVGTGTHSVCAYAINVGPGSNVLLRCLQVNAT